MERECGNTMKKVLIGLTTLLLATSLWAADYPIRYQVPAQLDSLWIIMLELDLEGAASDSIYSAVRASTYGLDTVWSVTSGTSYRWYYIPWYTGNDSAGPTTQYDYLGAESTTDTSLIKLVASRNPSIFYGPTLVGSGPYPMTFYAVDTVDAPTYDTVGGVTISLYDMTESLVYYASTGTSGGKVFNITSDSFAVSAYDNGIHDWRYDTITSADISANGSYSLKGYQLWTDPESSTDSACAVAVWVFDGSGNPLPNVNVTAQLTKTGVSDSSGHAISNRVMRSATNVLGVAQFECLWSSFLLVGGNEVTNYDGTTGVKWLFSVPVLNIKKEVIVPRQSSWTVDFAD